MKGTLVHYTLGISPKVMRPFILGLVGAAVLHFTGMQEEARGLVAMAVTSLGVGYVTPPGITMTSGQDLDADLQELLAEDSE